MVVVNALLSAPSSCWGLVPGQQLVPAHVEPWLVGSEQLVEALQKQFVPDCHPLHRVDPEAALHCLRGLHLGLHGQRGPDERCVDEGPDDSALVIF